MPAMKSELKPALKPAIKKPNAPITPGRCNNRRVTISGPPIQRQPSPRQAAKRKQRVNSSGGKFKMYSFVARH